MNRIPYRRGAMSLVLVLSAAPAAAADAIAGTWIADLPGVGGATSFLPNGLYYEAAVFDGDPVHTGLEWGSYSWDAATGRISATAFGDLNGDWGFAGDVNGPQYLTVSGNTGWLFQPGCADCSAPALRVTATASPVVGTWVYAAGGATVAAGALARVASPTDAAASPAATTVLTTFLADGRYVQASVIEARPDQTGIEWGTYSWDAATGLLSATALGDLNGDRGIAGDAHGPVYLNVNGDVASFSQPGCDACSVTATRIASAVPEPSTAVTTLLGLLGLAAFKRRRTG